MKDPELQSELDIMFESIHADIADIREGGRSSAPRPIVVPPTRYCLGSGGSGSAPTLDEVSINLNTGGEIQIFGFETGLPIAAKSIAEILMGV